MITKHLKRPDVLDYNRGVNPLSVWIHNHVELQIHKGDTLGQIVTELQAHYPKRMHKELPKIVAYWFALGERIAAPHLRLPGPWDAKEMYTSPKRRYRPRRSDGRSPRP